MLIAIENKVADNISNIIRGLMIKLFSLILFKKLKIKISHFIKILISITGKYEKQPIIKESKIKKLNSFFEGSGENKSIIFLPINPGNNKNSK